MYQEKLEALTSENLQVYYVSHYSSQCVLLLDGPSARCSAVLRHWHLEFLVPHVCFRMHTGILAGANDRVHPATTTSEQTPRSKANQNHTVKIRTHKQAEICSHLKSEPNSPTWSICIKTIIQLCIMKLIVHTCLTHKTPVQQKHLIIMHHLVVKLRKSGRNIRMIYPTKITFTNNTESTSKPLNGLLLSYLIITKTSGALAITAYN